MRLLRTSLPSHAKRQATRRLGLLQVRLGSCWLWLAPIVVGGTCAAAAQNKPAPTTIRVKIEATAGDSRMLLEKLNAAGADDNLKFELADQGFHYRIVFSTISGTTSPTQRQVNASGATAKVLDPQGVELFDLTRQARFTGEGATNAVAKEMIKRLLKLKPASQGD